MPKDKYSEPEISASFDAQADKLIAAGFAPLAEEKFAYPHRSWLRADPDTGVVQRLYLTTYRKGSQQFACSIGLHDAKRLCQKTVPEIHTGSLARIGKIVEEMLAVDISFYLKQLDEDLAYKDAEKRAKQIRYKVGNAKGCWTGPCEGSTIEIKVRVSMTDPDAESKLLAVEAELVRILGR